MKCLADWSTLPNRVLILIGTFSTRNSGDVGATLAGSGVREPDLENAFQTWRLEGRAKYTLHKIARWRRQAQSISRCDVPAHALDHYWAIDKRLSPLEDDVA